MKIRDAKKVDIDYLVDFRNALWSNSVSVNRQELASYFSGESSNIDQVYVAEISEVLVGFVELNLRNYAEGSSERIVPYVEGWYVREEFRRGGVGRALMNRAEKWAKDGGFHEIASDTELENQQGQSAHKKLGFTEQERIVCFIKRNL